MRTHNLFFEGEVIKQKIPVSVYVSLGLKVRLDL